MSEDFEFDAPRNLGVFVCAHVGTGGAPILEVAHDEDGDWQFLCGGDHGEDDNPMLVCLGHVVDGDPTLNQLAEMCTSHTATRTAPGSPWVVVDEMEAHVHRNIREHGWHVMIISGDDDGPGFAYSIGLDPELIVFGLKTEVMHWMINELGARMRGGEPCAPGDRVEGLLEGATCAVVEVDRDHYRGHFGYALWYHGGPSFRALQIVWPSKTTGTFPWEPGGESLRRDQPVLGPA
jgi:hypothetical protein